MKLRLTAFILLLSLLLGSAFAAGLAGGDSIITLSYLEQTYIPDAMRARINAFQNMLFFAASAVLGLVIGALGEVLDYRLCITLCGAATMLFCLLTVWKNRKHVRKVYGGDAS